MPAGSAGARNHSTSSLGAACALEIAARACSEPPAALEITARACWEPPVALEITARACSEPPLALAIAPKSLLEVTGSVTLSSVPLHTVLHCSVHGYAQVHTSIYIYIYISTILGHIPDQHAQEKISA